VLLTSSGRSWPKAPVQENTASGGNGQFPAQSGVFTRPAASRSISAIRRPRAGPLDDTDTVSANRSLPFFRLISAPLPRNDTRAPTCRSDFWIWGRNDFLIPLYINGFSGRLPEVDIDADSHAFMSFVREGIAGFSSIQIKCNSPGFTKVFHGSRYCRRLAFTEKSTLRHSNLQAFQQILHILRLFVSSNISPTFLNRLHFLR